ncbi:ComEC family competence protein [Paraliobacillus sp. PM-2]|uniref:DNA internalization-related competence protein ComEC/Rec2 n=1 Tax=Paraliobacillus sp. PM-2 TaxID=1462524 RepID=UPI00061C4E93|nr:DNA internalization-related competence protein ComEC/Rec2 [Paraliobacillus sp. PM-2]CQR46906.1 ComEC family competence protein [Paraliobacillus sp. PM-2]
MRGYWHLFAIAVIVTIIAITFNSYFLYGLFLIWLYILYRRHSLQNLTIMIMLAISVFTSIYYLPKEVDTSWLKSSDQSYTGTITSAVKRENNYLSFIFNIKENNNNIQLNYFFENKSEQPTSWKTGAACQLTAIPQTPSTSTNPGEFDYQSFLLQKGISKQLTLTKIDNLQCEGANVLDKFYRWQNKIVERVNHYCSTFTSSWLLALYFGVDTQLDEDIVDIFKRWNLSHLLAISGLHVGLITSFLYFIFIKMGFLSKEKGVYIILLFLFIYPFLSGGAPSVWRSCLMGVLGIILLQFRKKVSIIDIVSMVFLLCLVYNKYLIFQLGFQFSFLVTLGLVLSKKGFEHVTKVQLLFRISLISILILLPLQMMHFYYFNPLAILLNVFLIPYFSILVMPFLFFLLIICFFYPSLTTFLDLIFQWMHAPMLRFITWIDQHLFHPFVVGEFPYLYVWFYYILLIGLFMAIEYKKMKQVFISSLLLLCWIIWLEMRPYTNENGIITMLDVGQGDAMVIELPYRKGVIMIDVAGTFEEDFQTPSDRIYKQVIQPFLYSKGISQVDLIILSHADHDHIGSLTYLLKDFNIKHIVTSPYFDSPLLAEMSEEQQYHTVGYDDTFYYNGLSFQIIHPNNNYQDRNNNSLVVLAKLGQLKWLFTGDISDQIEQQIINIYPNLTVDVLKLAHHGSGDSTSESFIRQLDPKVAMISVGKDNRYGHPADKVIERLESKGIIVFRTDQQGAIQYTYKDNGERGTFSTFLP